MSHAKRHSKKTVEVRGPGESGLGLLEALLAIGLGAFVIMGVYRSAQDWRMQQQDNMAARHMLQVHEAAEGYVTANFSDIWNRGFGENPGDTNRSGVLENADLSQIGAVVPIPIQQMLWSTWYLKDGSGVLSPDFREVNDMHQGVTTFARNAGIIGGKRAIEVLTVTLDPVSGEFPNTRPLDENRIMGIAAVIGPKAGYITPVGVVGNACQNGVIKSLYGNWEMPMSALQTPRFGWSYCPTLAPATEGGYLAMYGRVFYEDTLGSDYLYRVAIPDQPELNRMQANLNMNGFSINDIRYMTADNIRVGGTVEVYRGSSSSFSGIGTYIDELLRVESDNSQIIVRPAASNPADRIYDASGNFLGHKCYFEGGAGEIDLGNLRYLNPDAVGPCSFDEGYLLVKGKNLPPGRSALTVDSLMAPESSIVAGSVAIANDINVGGTFTTPAISIDDPVGQVGSIDTDILQVSGPVTTNLLEAENFTSNETDIANLQVGSATVQAETVVTGTLATGSLSVVSNLNVAGKTSVNGNFTAVNADIGALGGCKAVVQDDGAGGFVTVPEYDCTP